MPDIRLHQPILGRATLEVVSVSADDAAYYCGHGYASYVDVALKPDDPTKVVTGAPSVALDKTRPENREAPGEEPPTTEEPTVVPRDDLASTQDRETAERPRRLFNPGDYSVAEVNEYLAAHPKDAERVLQAERENKARATVLRSQGNTAPEPSTA